MTSEKFKEQLIYLIKTDNEVRSLVSDIARQDNENEFANIFIERARTKYKAECEAESHNIPIENQNSIMNQLDDYFYCVAREIAENNMFKFQREINEDLEIEHHQNLETREKEHKQEIQYRQKQLDEQAEYLKVIPKYKLSEKRLLEIYDYLITNKMMEGSFSHFCHFCKMSGSKLDLNWIDTKGYNNKSKGVCYPLLFDLFHNIVFNQPKSFSKESRRIFLTSIMKGMKFNGDYVAYKNLNTAYSSWINQYSLINKI